MHWLVLIMGKNKKVLGKLSQLDLLRALAQEMRRQDPRDGEIRVQFQLHRANAGRIPAKKNVIEKSLRWTQKNKT